METLLLWGALGLCIVCLVDLPRATEVNKTLYGFFLREGKLTVGPFVAAILSANLSLGNFLIFVASWGFLFGWGGLFWFVVNLGLNVVAYLLFIPAFQCYIEDDKNSGTIHEFLSVTFGKDGSADRIRFVASATTVLGLLFAIVFELHLAADLFSRLSHLDIVTIFVFLTGIICVYSAVGGFHTLIFTDIVQSIVMFAGLAALVIILWLLAGLPATKEATSVYPISFKSLDIGWSNILSICIIGSGWFLVAMDQWQRSCATRNTSRTKRGMAWYLFSICGFAIVFGLLGIFDKTAILSNLSPEALSEATNGSNPLTDFFLSAPLVEGSQFAPYLYALVAISLIAAAMSTANTFLIVSGHSFVSDVLLAVFAHQSIHTVSDEQNRAFLLIARSAIIGMGVFVIAAWLVFRSAGFLNDPLSFFFIAYSIQFALLAPMVVARLPGVAGCPGRVVYSSIWVGVAVALFCGIGFWILVQNNAGPFLGLGFADWLAFTPVITWVIGTTTILVGISKSGGKP